MLIWVACLSVTLLLLFASHTYCAKFSVFGIHHVLFFGYVTWSGEEAWVSVFDWLKAPLEDRRFYGLKNRVYVISLRIIKTKQKRNIKHRKEGYTKQKRSEEPEQVSCEHAVQVTVDSTWWQAERRRKTGLHGSLLRNLMLWSNQQTVVIGDVVLCPFDWRSRQMRSFTEKWMTYLEIRERLVSQEGSTANMLETKACWPVK